MSVSKILSIAGSVLVLLGVILLIVTCAADYEYTVKYYAEQPDGTYVEIRNEVLTTKEKALNFEPEAKEHYSINRNKSKLTANFNQEENVILSVYYDANRYTVTFDIGALSLDSGNLVQSIFYGEDAVAPVVSSTDRAKFLNWSAPFTDVAGNITVSAVCNTDATVKVYHKIEQKDGSYVTSLAETKTVNASLGDYVHTPTELAHYTVNTLGSSLVCSPSVNGETDVTVCYDRASYTVRFDLSGLTHTGGVLEQTVKYGDTAVLPSFADNNGCIFLGWNANTSAPIEADTVFTANVNTTAHVKVSVYREQPNGQFTLFETLDLEADARLGNYTYAAPGVVGYTCNTATSTLSGNLTVNRETPLTVYYSINRYIVTFLPNGLTHVSGDLTQTVAHGEAATAPTVANTATLAFVRWDNAFDSITGNLTVSAVTTTDAPIRVITYKENLNGGYDPVSEDTVFANASLGTYTYNPTIPAYYTLNTTMSTLAVTPSILDVQTVCVYLDLARYTVTFAIDGLDHIGGALTQTVLHGGAAIAPSVANTATAAFVRWNTAFDNVTSNMTITAVVNSEATITIITYKENLSGGYDRASETTVSASAMLPSYTYSPTSITNYNVNTAKSTLTVTPSMLEAKTVEVYYDLVRYTVTFDIGDLDHIGGGELTQMVPYGGSATAPEVSGTRTADFQKWNRSFENVTSNITVRAVITTDAIILITHYYEHLSGGYVKGETTTKTVSAQQTTYTHAPAAEVGYIVNSTYGNGSCPLHAGKESTIEIYYDLQRYGVQFILNGVVQTGGELLQVVAHGGAAVAPQITNAPTILFVGWDKSFDNITGNLIVNAIVEEYTPIATRADLERIALDLGGNYILTSNINLAGTKWTPLGNFTGKLLGNGYTISGLTFNAQNGVGLFAKNSGIIDGLTLKDCSVTFTGENYANSHFKSSFFAYENSGTIKNCLLTGANSFNYANNTNIEIGLFGGSADDALNWTNTYRSGGFACYNYGRIEDCRISGTLTFNISTSAYYKFNTIGLTGVASGSHTATANCYFGGFCAENEGTVTGCVSTAAINTVSSAKADSVRNKDTSGNGRNPVTAKTNVTFGTIAAINNEKIEGCETLVATFDTSVSADGVREYASNTITYEESWKTLVGKNNDTITGSVATTS